MDAGCRSGFAMPACTTSGIEFHLPPGVVDTAASPVALSWECDGDRRGGSLPCRAERRRMAEIVTRRLTEMAKAAG